MRWFASVAGIGIVLAHAVVFVAVSRGCSGTPLRVDVAARTSSVPAEVIVAGADGPGVQRTEWHVRYRGGFDRSVGVTTLNGPFQSAADPPCGVRLHLGQVFLDDGTASPGTLAAFMRAELDREMKGFSVRGLGDFLRVDYIALRWTDAEGGALRVDLTLRFESAAIPVEIFATPELRGGALRWKTKTRARVRIDSGLKSLLVGVFRLQDNIDDAATGVGSRQVRQVAAGVNEALAAPPPVDLGGGRVLRFAYCDDVPVRIVDHQVATVSLALIPQSTDAVGPVHLARAGGRTPALDGALPLAFDFDLDTVNAVLHFLWVTGDLDARIRDRGVADWFNEAELVKRFLSVRIEDLELSLPPTAERERGPASPFSIAAEARLQLVDGARRMTARVFGRVGFELGTDDAGHLQPRLRLDDLALSCEPSPGVLEPCYGAVTDAARRHAPELHGPVADAMSSELDRFLHERRLGDDTAEFRVSSARVTTHPDGDSGWIRVGLLGRIVRR
jgi:hypothetical protein